MLKNYDVLIIYCNSKPTSEQLSISLQWPLIRWQYNDHDSSYHSFTEIHKSKACAVLQMQYLTNIF